MPKVIKMAIIKAENDLSAHKEKALLNAALLILDAQELAYWSASTKTIGALTDAYHALLIDAEEYQKLKKEKNEHS